MVRVTPVGHGVRCQTRHYLVIGLSRPQLPPTAQACHARRRQGSCRTGADDQVVVWQLAGGWLERVPGNSLVQLECGGSVEFHMVSVHSFDASLHEGGQPCDVLQVHSISGGFRGLLRGEHKPAGRHVRQAWMRLLSSEVQGGLRRQCAPTQQLQLGSFSCYRLQT